MTVLTTTKTWRRSASQTARRYTPDLTPIEIANVKRAITTLRKRHGGYAPLVALMGMKIHTIWNVMSKRCKPSVGLALRAARLANVPLEEILAGRWPVDGACPHCGRV